MVIPLSKADIEYVIAKACSEGAISLLKIDRADIFTRIWWHLPMVHIRIWRSSERNEENVAQNSLVIGRASKLGGWSGRLSRRKSRQKTGTTWNGTKQTTSSRHFVDTRGCVTFAAFPRGWLRTTISKATCHSTIEVFDISRQSFKGPISHLFKSLFFLH